MNPLTKLGELFTPAAERVTIREFFDTVYRPRRLGQSTAGCLQYYYRVIRLFDEHLGRDARLRDLSDEGLAAFVASASERYQQTTVYVYLHVLHAIWQSAHGAGMVRKAPRKLRLPQPKPIPCVLAPQQAAAVWQAIQQQAAPVLIELSPTALEMPGRLWWSALFLVCRDSGKGVDEVVRLKLGDVDFDGATANFPGSAKQGIPPQSCPLTVETVAALREVIACYRYRHGGSRLFRWADSVPNMRATLASLMLQAGLSKSRKLVFRAESRGQRPEVGNP